MKNKEDYPALPAHSPYAPSSAYRWLECHGAISATAALSNHVDSTNIYAARGSVIHAMAERIFKEKYTGSSELLYLKSNYGSVCPDLPLEFSTSIIDIDMCNECDTYIRAVRLMTDSYEAVFVEQFCYSSEGLYGTADIVAVGTESILICDLKTGRVSVSPENNTQLLTYAMMVYDMLLADAIENGDDVWLIPTLFQLVIVQPVESSPVKTWECDLSDIEEHRARVQIAMAGYALKSGEHCKYCAVAGSCAACDNEAAFTMEKLESFDGLTGNQWADRLTRAAALEDWCKAVHGRAQAAAEHGVVIPEYKVVQKYGLKTWTNADTAARVLEGLMGDEIDHDIIFNDAKIRTPTQLIKQLKDVVSADDINELAETPLRGHTLVKSSDRREAIVFEGDTPAEDSSQMAMFSTPKKFEI